jgi:hypothetical protein
MSDQPYLPMKGEFREPKAQHHNILRSHTVAEVSLGIGFCGSNSTGPYVRFGFPEGLLPRSDKKSASGNCPGFV